MLILKLVSSQREHPSLLSEPETFEQLAAEHPEMASDCELGFPLAVVDCGVRAQRSLIVMPDCSVRATRLSDWLPTAPLEEVSRGLEALGKCVKRFHSTYKLQHTDLLTSNVFIERTSSGYRCTLIDLGDVYKKAATQPGTLKASVAFELP